MEKIIYYPIFPNPKEEGSERADDVKNWVRRFLLPSEAASYSEEKANVYLVGGGDSLLMETVRKKYTEGKIIFGINRGTVGFLLNQIKDINQLPEYAGDLKLVSLELIQGEFFLKNGETKIFIAFNDIFCGGNIADYIEFNIKGELPYFPNRTVKGNGIIVSTPQGTTGFALNSRGSPALLPLDSKSWFIGGVATGPYPCDQVSKQRIEITVKSRNPVNGYADGYKQEAKNIEKIIITPTNYTVKLGFLANVDFSSRRTALAQRVERGEVN